MIFKKISAIVTSALLVGMTAGVAAAASFPAPFNGASAAIVYGANAPANTDRLAATTIQGKVPKGMISGTDVGTGDQVSLAGSRAINYGDSINAARTSLSSSDLPSVLADGKVVDLGGVEYKYTQSIVLGATQVAYGTSGGDLNDPALYLDVGTAATAPLYNYTLSFTKNLNVSDATNVQGQKINILGVDYVIGASSTNSTLYLYGAGQTVSLAAAGDKQSVNIAGINHDVTFVGATGTTTAKIEVDGVGKTVTKGSSYTFTGDLNVYVKDVTYQAYASGVQTIELVVGANTLLLQNGQTVKRGAEQTSVQGTMATVTPAGAGIISGFSVAVAMNKSTQDQISEGAAFTDDVFGGLKVQFVKANPGLTDSSRAKIKVSTDNNQYAYLTFTSAKAGLAGEKQITYAYDNSTASTTVQPLLAKGTLSGGYKGAIHVLEGELAYVGDQIVINQGDSGAILQVDDISINSGTAGTVSLSDVITGDTYNSITLSNSSSTSNSYTRTGVTLAGGTGYTISTNLAGTAVNISWSTANTLTLFPRIKLKDGGWVAILTETNVTVNSTTGGNGALTNKLIFPDGQTTLSTTGTTVDNSTTTYYVNGVTWGASGSATNATVVQNITGGGALCNFNRTMGPAILYLEPKKWNDNTAGDYICVPMTTTGSTEIAIGTPVLNGTDSGFLTFGSDNYKSAAVDKYGAFVTMESRTNENGVATIYTPATQMFMDLKFTAQSVTLGQTNAVIVTDAEVAATGSTSASMDLVVVGGSCINTVAAKLLGSTAPVCGAEFTTATTVGAGQFLIKTYQSPYSTTKVATLVAGYDADDTTKAANYLTTQTVDTTVGTGKVYSSATSAVIA